MSLRIVSYVASAPTKVKVQPEDIAIHSDAGLSDHETKGSVREAAERLQPEPSTVYYIIL